ncbi:MAG: ferritin-like domain-containing protein [Alphaproteobacteria bacterium]|nr:ferritin-like domain-containing protein [Alphaproteobacteria bacterium]
MTTLIKHSAFALETGRRALFSGAGQATLSASAVALLVGCESMAQGERRTAQAGAADVNILNVALGLEHEAITAYQLGAESGLLQPAVLQVAVAFQSHHKEHRDALVATIRKLGGMPVAEKPKAEVARDLNAAALKNQTDILRLAARLERGAANAYLGVIPSFGDRALAQVAGRLAADETMHWTALAGALAEALPAKALSFGA